MNQPFFVVLALTLLTTLTPDGVATAAFYKFVDSDGVVTYSHLKPRHGNYKVIRPSCRTSYLGCQRSAANWSQAKLNTTAYQQVIAEAATKYRLEPALIRAVIHSESSFNSKAVSKAGAEGLMQLMPATQERFGVADPFNSWENINAGSRYLRLLLDQFQGDIRLAAAAYNAGENAVKRYNGIPPYDETRNYVRRVSLLYQRYLQSSNL
ncbi:MAG: lytic transglycosylase domain-containing protein [Gammaproteobacteria bacterium]|nr:lytic transglycosylase domain-containing protein [Gammaproteobacteria bacterium]